MSRFRRRLLLMMQKVQEIWRDVVLTGTGVIVATDTTEGQRAKIFPQGWTKQDQYEGKNLFDIGKVVDSANVIVIKNTIVVKNGASGVLAGSPYKLSDYFPKAEIGKTYMLSFSYVNVNYIFLYGAGEFWKNKKTKQITQEMLDSTVYFYSKEGEDNIYSDIMLNEGSTALPYEPYTGNKPSPSPEYPQPITNSGTYNEDTGKYECRLKMAPKNLVDLTVENTYGGNLPVVDNIENGIEFSYQNVRDKYCILDYQLEKGKKYYISYDVYRDADATANVYRPVTIGKKSQLWYQGNVYNEIWGTTDVSEKEKHFYNSFVTPSDEDSIIYISGNNNGTATGITKIYNLCISEAEGDIFYPYKEPQNVTLTSDRPLTQWDRLVYMDGQWQWEYGGLSKILTQDMVSGLHSSKSIIIPEKNVGISGDRSLFYFNNLIMTNAGTSDMSFGTAKIAFTNIYLKIEGIETVEDARNWLQDNETILWTQSDTPEYIPLQESEQQALNALKTYYPTTVFSNNQEGFMQVEYRTKYGTDNVVYIDDGFLETNTSTATSEPTENGAYPNAWCTNSIDVTEDDKIVCETTANSNWQRTRLYYGNGSYYIGVNSFNTTLSSSLKDAKFFRFVSADGSGTIESLKVVHADGTEDVYQVIDRRTGG